MTFIQSIPVSESRVHNKSMVFPSLCVSTLTCCFKLKISSRLLRCWVSEEWMLFAWILKSPRITNFPFSKITSAISFAKSWKNAVVDEDGGRYKSTAWYMTDTDTIFITMCSKESYEGESHCLIERWFLYIRATPPPWPVSRGLCTISYVGGNSSARQVLSFPSPLSHDSVTKVKSISLLMMSSWISKVLLQTEQAFRSAPLSCLGLWTVLLSVDFCRSMPAALPVATCFFLVVPRPRSGLSNCSDLIVLKSWSGIHGLGFNAWHVHLYLSNTISSCS